MVVSPCSKEWDRMSGTARRSNTESRIERRSLICDQIFNHEVTVRYGGHSTHPVTTTVQATGETEQKAKPVHNALYH
jgi:hypothetical protein